MDCMKTKGLFRSILLPGSAAPVPGHPVFWACVLFFTFLASGAADAQIFGRDLFNRQPEAPRAPTRDEIGVPVPVTGRAEVPKGREVQFEIRAETNTPGATVEFLIRKFPTAGKIVSLTSNPSARNRAIVTYYADPESGAESDVFAFAVRYRGGRYSSEMRYDIDLVGGSGGGGGGTEIEVTKEVDFGEVMVGSEKIGEVTVRNLGATSYSHRILLQAPWHLVEPRSGQLELNPRQGAVVKVAFRPQMIGETSYFLSFSRSSQGTAKLSGTGAEPFSILTEALELEVDETTNRRQGELELVNHGERPLMLNARGSARLEASLDEVYLLPPGNPFRIPLALEATDVSPLDGMVQFSLDNGYTKNARVFAPVVPPRLDLAVVNSYSKEVINFGQVEAGRSTERAITVTNRGGVAVPLEFHVPEPFRLLTDPGPQLMPLSSINLTIGLLPGHSQRGLVDVTMNVYGNEQTLPLRLLGNVVKPSGPAGAGQSAREPSGLAAMKGLRLGGGKGPSPGSGSGGGSGPVTAPDEVGSGAATPAEEGKQESHPPIGSASSGIALEDRGTVGSRRRDEVDQDYFEPKDMVVREINPNLRSPEDLNVFASGTGSVTIGWTAPSNSPLETFVVEMPGIELFPHEDALPQRIWRPIEVAKFERIGRLVKAQIRGLPPGHFHEFRVLTLGPDGRASVPSEVLTAETELPMDWTYIYLAFGIAVLFALGLTVRKILLDRRPEVYQAQYLDA